MSTGAKSGSKNGQPSRKPHKVALWLSNEDHAMLAAIIVREKDSTSNVIRRMIRTAHDAAFTPRQQALTLLLPQSATPDFGSLSNVNVNDKNEKDFK